jgi:hypothetical protein
MFRQATSGKSTVIDWVFAGHDKLGKIQILNCCRLVFRLSNEKQSLPEASPARSYVQAKYLSVLSSPLAVHHLL